MSATDAWRRANDAFLISRRNQALSAGLESQPKNTAKAYKKAQADFVVSGPPFFNRLLTFPSFF
jgi:hypothetical protein